MSLLEAGITPVIPEARIETQQKERLSDAELGDLLSSMGNHEAKAILLGRMSMSNIYTRMGAKKLMDDAQGANVGWKQKNTTAFGYLQNSLAPIGLVAREIVEGETLDTVGYVKTTKGQELGEPFAGLLLDFSLRYPDFSLIDLFASTNSKYLVSEDTEQKKRAPMTRMKVFWELATANYPLSTVEIKNATGETVGPHLRTLSEKGIIKYEVLAPGGARAYQIKKIDSDMEFIPTRGRISLANYVFQTISEDPNITWTVDELVAKYIDLSGRNQAGRHSLEKHIRFVLKDLEVKGYLMRPLGTEKSKIDVNDENKNMIIDLVSRIDQFQGLENEVISFWRSRLIEILNNPRLVAQLMIKAQEHSSMGKAIPKELTYAEIRTILYEFPGINANQIAKILEERQRKKLSKSTVSSYLHYLINIGELRTESLKTVFHYYLN